INDGSLSDADDYETVVIDATAITTTIVDNASISNPENSTVDEDDLLYGSDDTKESLIDSGLLGVEKGGEDIDVVFKNIVDGQDSGLTSDGAIVYYYLDDSSHLLKASTATDETKIDEENTIFTNTIKNYDSNLANYEFVLKDSIDHDLADGENIKQIDFDFKILANQNEKDSDTFSVTIVDDTPLSANQNDKLEIGPQQINIVMVLDLSGSMHQDFSGNGSATSYSMGYDNSRMKAAKESADSLIQEYAKLGEVNLLLTVFGSEATVLNNGTWYEGEDAARKAILGDNLNNNVSEGLQAYNTADTNYTNYEDAVYETYTNYTKLDGTTIVYFLTDGKPSKENDDVNSVVVNDDGTNNSGYYLLDKAYVDGWSNFLNSDEISDYNIVGFGTENGLEAAYLNILDVNGVEDEGTFNGVQKDGYDTNVKVVDSAINLNNTLVEDAVVSESGNIIVDNSGDLYINGGADGAFISEIVVENKIYSYDGVNILDGNGTILVSNDSNITIETTLREDGDISKDIASFLDIDFNSGNYKYSVNASLGDKQYSESINIKVKDKDGDETSIELKFDINTSTSNDITVVYNTTTAIDAKDGYDKLILTTDKDLDFSVFDSNNIKNIEEIDLSFNGDHKLSGLKLDDIVNITDDDNELVIKGDFGDSIDAIDALGWNKVSQTDNGNGTNSYNYAKSDSSVNIILTIDDNINNSGL
ncbi:MAG: hypothetical protein JXQ66_02105, partial [Campylobacterales bacterium]|nr:hypothetical protein [Campylobacterales bacterium]